MATAISLGVGTTDGGAARSPHSAVHTTATAGQYSSAYSGGRLMAADPNGGYWTVNWVGVITSHEGAPTFGSPALSGIKVSKPIVGMASTPDGQGYWLVGSDGGVFAYGDAQFFGSTGALRLNQPIVGMAATQDGQGYWLVASDGGVFTYGDAQFYGSTGSIHLNQPIVGMAVTPDGQGYWMVASDGGIFTFGDAQFLGSTGSIHLNQPIVGMATTLDGQGYWLVASDGGVFTFGDAGFDGSFGLTNANVLGIIISPPTVGYTLVTTDGNASLFSSPPTAGSEPALVPTPTATPDATQGTDCQPTQQPVASVDTVLTNLIASQTGPGWLGGDATYSTSLPGDREAFVFSDTLIGTAQESGAANITGFIHNSELIGTMTGLNSAIAGTGAMTGLNSDIAGTDASPQTLIQDTLDPGDQWQVAATYVENGNQLVFVNEFAPVAGSDFARFTGQSGIAVMKIPGDGVPVFSSVTPVPTDILTQWGTAFFQYDGYDYIYGADSNTTTGAYFGLKLARVSEGESLDSNEWQYWNGLEWTAGENNAIPLNTGQELTGVTAQASNGGFVGVSIPNSVYTDKAVYLSYACSPTGPWSAPTPVYTIPQISEYDNELAYIPTFHRELSSPGEYVISYNVDTTDNLPALQQNVHEYQPQFLNVVTGS